MSLITSSRTRSADTIASRPVIERIAATVAGSTSNPSCAANRAARIIRSGSSLNESAGAPGVVIIWSARSSSPSLGSTNSRLGSSTAIALIVKSRRTQVADERVAELDRRLAGLLRVHVRAVRRDLEVVIALAQPDRAERDPGLPDRVGPPRDDLQGPLRPSAGGQVEVGGARRPSSASRTGPPTSASSSPAAANRAPTSVSTGWSTTIARAPAAAPPTASSAPAARRVAGSGEEGVGTTGKATAWATVRARLGGALLAGSRSAAPRPGYHRRMARREPAGRHAGLRPSAGRPLVNETSAGGLVFTTRDGVVQGALIGRRDRRGILRWLLPKGHIEDGESGHRHRSP